MFKLFVRWLEALKIALNQWLQTFFPSRPQKPRSKIIKSACVAHNDLVFLCQFFMASSLNSEKVNVHFCPVFTCCLVIQIEINRACTQLRSFQGTETKTVEGSRNAVNIKKFGVCQLNFHWRDKHTLLSTNVKWGCRQEDYSREKGHNRNAIFLEICLQKSVKFQIN